jgi:hypothetical protein
VILKLLHRKLKYAHNCIGIVRIRILEKRRLE